MLYIEINILVEMVKIVPVLFLLLSFLVRAQPGGGGGGLSIEHIYNEKHELIDLRDTHQVVIRSFDFLGKYVESFAYEEALETAQDKSYFPIVISTPMIKRSLKKSDHRLLIVYKEDTMLIDFLNVLGPNGRRNIDSIDSLVFSKGYYIYDRRVENFWKDDRDMYDYLKNGLTNASINALNPSGIIRYEEAIDRQFIVNLERSQEHHYNCAKHALLSNDLERMNTSLNNAKKIGKGTGKYVKEYNPLRAEYFNQLNQMDSAVFYISQLIQASGSRQNYSTRLRYLTKAGRHKEAINDLDVLVEIEPDKVHSLSERGKYYHKYLNDNSKALDDLNSAIALNEWNRLSKEGKSYNKYASLYIVRGQILYASNKRKKAYDDWIKAMHKWRANPGEKFFDSLIIQRDKDPELYLCRAMANLFEAHKVYSRELNTYVDKVLQDVQRCHELKYNNHLVSFYEASAYQRLKDYDRALESIDKSILVKNDYPDSYLVRYRIKYDKDRTIKQNEDVDFLKYRELIGKPIEKEFNEDPKNTQADDNAGPSILAKTFSLDSIQAQFDDLCDRRKFTLKPVLLQLNEFEQVLLEYVDSATIFPTLKTMAKENLLKIEERFGYHGFNMWEKEVIELTFKMGKIKHLIGDFDPDKGACTWLKGAQRKGVDMKKYQTFCDTCESIYSQSPEFVNKKETYRHHRFLKKNIEQFNVSEEISVGPYSTVSHRLRYYESTKRQKKYAEHDFEFLVLFSGDTLPYRVRIKSGNNETDIFSYDLRGNIIEKTTHHRFFNRHITKNFEGEYLKDKVVFKKTLFKRKIVHHSPHTKGQKRRRMKRHVKTIIYGQDGEKLSVLKGNVRHE